MLPSKINLGCGNIVKIDQVPRATIQSVLGQDTQAAWSCGAPEGCSYVGVIFVDKTLSESRKRVLLYHELQHAMVDIFQWESDAAKGRGV